MLVTLEHISKHYVSPAIHGNLEILKDISVAVKKGERIAIVGPSGSGKSTLLNIIGALDRPSGGHVIFDGEDLSLLSEDQLALIRNRDIGFIFQLHHLLPQCSTIENILIPTLPRYQKKDHQAVYERAVDLLNMVGLSSRMYHLPGQLSGGECQRAAVVRALINKPQLLLADEPTGQLDHQSAVQLGDLLIKINEEQNVTIILVTHSRELARRMGIVYELQDGKLV